LRGEDEIAAVCTVLKDDEEEVNSDNGSPVEGSESGDSSENENPETPENSEE
jgi:hypothetical protein